MRIVIVEDEPPARERLAQMIRRAEPQAEVAGQFATVRESIDWLQSNPPPQLLFLDIQLTDGSSFDIVERTKLSCPVIFVTAFDEYLLEALIANGIDYLLKPVRQERLEVALQKYRRLETHFTVPYQSLVAALAPQNPRWRTRFLVRKRLDFVVVRAEEVAYFYSTHKLTFLVDRSGEKYLLDQPLAELELELDSEQFFRVNRNLLTSLDAVAKFQPEIKGRLTVQLRPPFEGEVLVSQERARPFRQWLAGVR